MEEVISSFDDETRTHRPSGNHSRRSIFDDVKALSEQLKCSHLFHLNSGRTHSAFLSFPVNLSGGTLPA